MTKSYRQIGTSTSFLLIILINPSSPDTISHALTHTGKQKEYTEGIKKRKRPLKSKLAELHATYTK